MSLDSREHANGGGVREQDHLSLTHLANEVVEEVLRCNGQK